MPLSEHEKRLLEEIESALSTEEPRLAARLRARRAARAGGRGAQAAWLRAGAVLVGLFLLLLSPLLATSAGVTIGLLGYLFIVRGVTAAITARGARRRPR